MDAQGWSTFRLVTSVDNGVLSYGDLYYLDSNGKWVFGGVRFFLMTKNADLMIYDSVIYGDNGGGEGGAWHEDYFYLTQQNDTIEAFQYAVDVQRANLNNDNTVSMGDFAVFASDWLTSSMP